MHNKAFSLIEMAIVIVIIGLIIGAVLTGGLLIRAAEIRSEISTLREFETAARAFQLKYGELPGDFSDLDTIEGVDDLHHGDGDGVIGISSGGGSEFVFAWEHLSKAGLIEGTYDGVSTSSFASPVICVVGSSCPPTPFNRLSVHYLLSMPVFGAMYNSPFSNDARAVAFLITNGEVFVGETGGLTVDQAFGIDVKVDDGVASTGRFMSGNGGGLTIGCVEGDAAMSDPSLSHDYVRSFSGDNCTSMYVLR